VNSDLCTVTTPTDGGFRLRPTRWRPESGSLWQKQVLKLSGVIILAMLV